MKKKVIQTTLWLLLASGINLAYATTVNAFVVELFKSTSRIDSLADADALIGGHNLKSTSSGNFEVIDFRDVDYFPSAGFWGHSNIDNFFPGTTGSNNLRDYAVRATANIEIPTADDWTFLISNDDGGRLRIDGLDVIVDDTTHATEDHLGTTNLSVGSHEVELVLFERTGEATLELWAAQGVHSSYNSSDFRLVGDIANGGLLATETEIPFEFSPSIGLALLLGLSGMRQLLKQQSRKHLL